MGDLLAPDFLVIGAMRSATGWIRQCLREHPDVFMPQKEAHFFDQNYEKGLPWYMNHFHGFSGEKVVGEKTASYLHCNETAERISFNYPDIKIICCLRDPVQRLNSHFTMFESNNPDYNGKDIFDVATIGSDFVQRSMYYSKVKNYFENFPIENIQVLLYEEKDKDPFKFLKTIYSFLDVDNEFVAPSTEIQTKLGAYELSSGVRKRVSSFFLHPRSPVFLKRIYSGLRSGKAKGDVSDEYYHHFAPFFKKDIESLEILLARELSHWKTKMFVNG